MELTEEDKKTIFDHYTRLLDHGTRLFLFNQLNIDPKFSKVHVGFYASAKRLPVAERSVVPFSSHKEFKLKLSYTLVTDTRPVSIASDESGDYEVKPFVPSGITASTPLLHWMMRADFSEDDEEEMRRCMVKKAPAAVLGNMSRDTRKVYKGALSSIRDKPIELRDMKAQTFINMLASLGTYEPMMGAYYEKWQADDGTGRKRTFPGSLTPEYIKNNIAEVLLAKGRDYLLITSDVSFELFEIGKGDGVGEVELKQVLGGQDTFHGSIAPWKPRTVVLFHSLEGEKETKQQQQNVHLLKDVKPQRLILDPRGMVEAIIGEEGGKQLGIDDPFDWFVEMCIAYFPREFYTVDFNTFGGEDVWKSTDSFKMMKKEMDASVRWIMEGNDKDFRAEKLDPIRRADIEKVLAGPRTIVFPQALKFGNNTRLIAADLSWAYFCDLTTGVVYTEKTSNFVENYRTGVIAADVYESTRGVIPLVALVFAAAAVGVGTAFVATAGLGGAFVNYAVRELTVKQLTSMAMKRLARFAAPAILAYTGKLVATIFVYADPKNTTAIRWRAFADGFFKGYLVNTLYDQFFNKLKTMVTAGPKEYRAYKMIKKIYAAIDKARDVIDKLEKELDEKSVKLGIKHFETAATHAIRGIALLFPGLYYAHHEDMDAVSDGLAGPADVDTTEKDLFEIEQVLQIAEIAKQLKPLVHDTKSLLDSIRDNRALQAGIITVVVFRRDVATGIIELAKLSGTGAAKLYEKRGETIKAFQKRVTGALTNPTVWKILAGVAIAAGVIHEIKTGGAGTKAVIDGAEDVVATIGQAIEMLEPLFKELITSWPGSTEDRARTHGEIVGGMLGAIAFNRFLFGSKKERKAVKGKKWEDSHIGEKWMKAYDWPFLGSAVKNNIKLGIVGPILAAIFRRYISLFKQMKQHGWPDAPERTEEAFGKLLGTIEDAILDSKGLRRLALFKEYDEDYSFSLSHLVRVLFRLRDVVGSDLKAYVEYRAKKGDIDLTKFLPEEFEAVIKAANTWGMPDLVAKYGPQLYVVMATHLHVALGELGTAFEALFEPWTKSNKGWMTLLKELGLEVGDVDEAVKQLNAAKKDALKSFE